MQKKENSFDFNGSMSNFNEMESKQKREADKKRKQAITIGVGAVLGVAGAGYIINSTIEANRAEIDQKVSQAKTNNSDVSAIIKFLEKSEGDMRVERALLEAKMNSGFSQKTSAITLMELQTQVAKSYKELNEAHLADNRTLQANIKSMETLKSLLSAKENDYDSKEEILSPALMKNWEANTKMLKDNKYIPQNLSKSKSSYENLMEQIVTFERQYVQVVKEVIASGNYSLNSTQADIMNTIKKEGESSRNEFSEVFSETKEASKALVAEGKDSNGLDTAFTESDLKEANEGVQEMENVALAKALEDRKVIEAMIAQVQGGQSVESVLGMTGKEPEAGAVAAAPSSPAPAQASSSGSSVMPFLMGMWLGNAFSSAPSYNSPASSFSSNKDRVVSGGAGSSVAANSSRLQSVVNNTKATSAYSFKSKESYLNKNMATNSSRALGSRSENGFAKAQSQMAKAQVASARATSLKNAAFSKAGIAPGTKASQARMAISQSRASASARGGFSGGRGMSSGG